MARIVIIGSYPPSLVKFRGELISDIVGLGHEVYVCAPEPDTGLKNKLVDMGVHYRTIGFQRAGIDPAADVKVLWELYRLFRKLRPDAVLGYTIKPVIYGSLAARLAGVNRIYSMITGLGYTFLGQGRKARLVGLIAKILYRISLSVNSKVFFQNPDDLQLFQQRALVKPQQAVQINGSGVNLKYFSSSGGISTTPDFLLIARLLRDKGIYEFVEAAKQLKEAYPDKNLKFTMVGWLDENPAAIDPEDLERWAASGLISYLGKLDDVRSAINDSSVYVLPSYREGTPRTVLEAMSMGRPIITTDAPGCRETVIHGRNGFVVPVKDSTALSQAMERFINEPSLIPAMGAESRKLAEEKFDVRKVNKVIISTMKLGNETIF